MSTADGSGRARITGRGIGSARNGLPADMLPSGRYEFGQSRPELRPPVPPSGAWGPGRQRAADPVPLPVLDPAAVRTRREALGLTQDALAARAQVTRITITRLETGARRPYSGTLRRVAAVLWPDSDAVKVVPAPRPARATARQDATEPARAPDAAGPMALRKLPPVTSKDELEARDADCPECKGAKASPRGTGGQVITCPACDGTGERRPAPGPGPACEPEPLPGVAKPGRCRKCKYLTTAAGHKIACGDGAS